MRALVTAAYGLKGALGGTAQEMLSRSWPALEHPTWPRAQAIALVALSERAEHVTPEPAWVVLAERYAGNLLRLYHEVAHSSWPWFEPYLSYSNAKLPHGLIACGRVFGRHGALVTGLNALRWLEEQQSAPDGAFLPVGSERVLPRRRGPGRCGTGSPSKFTRRSPPPWRRIARRATPRGSRPRDGRWNSWSVATLLGRHSTTPKPGAAAMGCTATALTPTRALRVLPSG